jgi:hypothetical protein
MAGEKTEDNYNDGNHQKQVDEASRNTKEEAAAPKKDKNCSEYE